MLPQSSPIAYPQSSSPPAQLVGRKRPAPPEAPRDSIPHLAKRGSPLSIRDPNCLNDRDAWKKITIPGAVASVQAKPALDGPFIDDDDDESAEDAGSEACAHFQNESNSMIDILSTLPPTKPSNVEERLEVTTASKRRLQLKKKYNDLRIPYEQLIAGRSSIEPGQATKSFYGIEIHKLLEKATEASTTVTQNPQTTEVAPPSTEIFPGSKGLKKSHNLMWTEKYRARKFTDLVGDERTHRDVLRWVKHWDPIVFPGSGRPKPKGKLFDDGTEEGSPCKILLLTGPPGLGKTTLAHVCARQAGYEVVEINASDERSRDVVKGRIRDLVGTENVRGVKSRTAGKTVRKAGRPVCVVVDEVDGVVSGSGAGGEGGFIKALIDLVVLDQKNAELLKGSHHPSLKRKRKGDQFRLLRPMILICNDVYHPALRPLRSSGIADIIHVRKPSMDKVVNRLKAVFETEGIACDVDGVRRLCEVTWGVSKTADRSTGSGTAEGDIRSLLVVGEWVAARFRAQRSSTATESTRLTRQWIQQHILEDLASHGSATRNLGRGSAKEVLERVFQDNAGFPKGPMSIPSVDDSPATSSGSLGVSEAGKRNAMGRLRDLLESSGDSDRITSDCFTAYAAQPFQDDTLLSKPCAAHDWLHFHDSLSTRIFSDQEWELNPYMSVAALGFHHLFASTPKHAEQPRMDNDDKHGSIPFSGPRADYDASEAHKQNKAILETFHSSLAVPLSRCFHSDQVAVVDLLPSLTRILNPNVKPIIVGGSGEQKGVVSVRRKEEREMLERAVSVMNDVGVTFERSRVETTQGGGNNYVYRMEPAIDALMIFETASSDRLAASTARYAIRQALDQEYQKFLKGQRARLSQQRLRTGSTADAAAIDMNDGRKQSTSMNGKGSATAVKRDFFGRIIQEHEVGVEEGTEICQKHRSKQVDPDQVSKGRVFVSFHEGYSNAVRKPITLDDLMKGL